MALIIGICGPSGSGKTTIAKQLADEYSGQIVSADNYFLLDPPYKKYKEAGKNWELPENTDWNAYRKVLKNLKNNHDTTGRKIIWQPLSYTDVALTPTKHVFAEGFLLLHDLEILKLLDISVYVDIPDSVGTARRLKRDGSAENREWYETVTFPEYAPRRELFAQRADLVLDGTEPLERNIDRIKKLIDQLED